MAMKMCSGGESATNGSAFISRSHSSGANARLFLFCLYKSQKPKAKRCEPGAHTLPRGRQLVEVRSRWFGVEDASKPRGAEARSLGGLKGSARL